MDGKINIIPVNACAFMAYKSIASPSRKEEWSAYRSLTDKERPVLEFLYDREVENKVPETHKKNIKIAAFKFNISEEEVKRIERKFYDALAKASKNKW